ncbi:hypothetical protein [Peribacillus sp. YIM B13477]|uniref:hypothetical protein n=1 Tax=Peribacillus sp. YIM B13477 TaxID=3366300 RepID=UPI00366DE721
MADKKIIKQNGDKPIAMIDSELTININADSQGLAEIKRHQKGIRKDVKETQQKIGGLGNYLANLINKGFEKLSGSIGYDFAVNMNTLQRGGSNAPPLSQVLLKRTQTVSKHKQLINDFTWLNVYGDVLTGKTHYIYLLAEKGNPENCIWIKCKDLNIEQTVMTFKVTLAEITKTPISSDNIWYEKVAEKLGQETLVIIDDLPSFKNNDSLFEVLYFLYYACKKYGVKIISSSSININQNLIRNFNKDYVGVQIPPFTVEDIQELLKLKNNSLNNTEKLAYWVGAVTKYNPALTLACVDYLETKNWEITNEVFKSIQDGFYSTELSREARDLLLNEIDSDDTKELLYRLSIISNVFDIRYVDNISAILPEIKHPYDKLHQLEGYWLQRNGEEYRISPLLEKIGATNLPVKTVKAVHLCIAQILGKTKVLSPIEFVKMFSHLIQAEEYNNGAHALYLVLTELINSDIDKDYWGISSIWYDMPLPPKISNELKFLIRAKQIITCLKFNKDVSYLINDLNRMDENNQFAGAIFLMLAVESIDYNPDLSLTYLQKFLSLQDDQLLKEVFKENLEKFIWIYPLKIKGDLKLTQKFLAIIENMTDEQLAKSYDEDMYYDSAMLLVDNIWLEELRKVESFRDWEKCIKLFLKIKEIGEKKNDAILFSCSVRALIIVKFEYQKKEEEALKIYHDALSFPHHQNDSLFLLHAIIGKQYIFIKKYEEGERYLLSALQLSENHYPFETIDALFFAAKCKEGNNSGAVLGYLQKALHLNCKQELKNELINIKILGELGVFYFNEGKHIDSYNAFKEAVTGLRNIEEKNNPWKSTLVVFGHVLGFINHFMETGTELTVFRNNETYAKPSLGFFWIENEKRHEFYNMQRDILINLSMGKFAGDVNFYEDAKYWLNIAEKELKQINYVAFSILTKRELIPYLIIDGDYQESIDKCIEYSIQFIASKNNPEKEIIKLEDLELIIRDAEKLSGAIDLSVPFVFIPLMLHLLELKVKRNENIELISIEILKNIKEIKTKYGETEVLNSILKVFAVTFSETQEEKDILSNISEYPNDVKVIYYLAHSIVTTKKEALELHLMVVEYLYSLYQIDKFVLLEIILPFFKTFWLHSYIDYRYDFQNTDIIDSQLEVMLKRAEESTLKQLLKLMVTGLNPNVPSQALDFLES